MALDEQGVGDASIDPDVMAEWRAYRDTLRVVVVDGKPDYFDPDEPVSIRSGGLTFEFDWFPGCEVTTLGGGVVISGPPAETRQHQMP
jgi:hypothetical protein